MKYKVCVMEDRERRLVEKYLKESMDENEYSIPNRTDTISSEKSSYEPTSRDDIQKDSSNYYPQERTKRQFTFEEMKNIFRQK